MPRRIVISGTRGKSGLTRIIAAGIRASGSRVMAKTTGSKPVVILPDGTEREIPRAGPASIREQVRLVTLAAEKGVDTLVAETMSISPECLAAESRYILRPTTLALTNVRLDHLDEMGQRKDEAARALASAFPERADIFIPEEELYPVFEQTAASVGSKLHPVVREAAGDRPGAGPHPPLGQFEPQVRLARAILEFLGIDRETAARGMAGAACDLGALRAWRGGFGEPPQPAICVSVFAANEPESSAAALGEALARIPLAGRPLVGILSLREDRGDRTLQWVRASGEGFFREFAAVVLIGAPARAALRKIGRTRAPAAAAFSFFDGSSPDELMNYVLSLAPSEPVVVGLGNIVGLGERIIHYWDEKGTVHDR